VRDRNRTLGLGLAERVPAAGAQQNSRSAAAAAAALSTRIRIPTTRGRYGVTDFLLRSSGGDALGKAETEGSVAVPHLSYGCFERQPRRWIKAEVPMELLFGRRAPGFGRHYRCWIH